MNQHRITTMNRQELLQAILSTRTDHRMTSTERAALKQVIGESRCSPETLVAVRHDIFRSLTTPPRPVASSDLLWLEQVVNLLDRKEQKKAGIESRAWFGPGDPMVEQLEGMIRAARRCIDVAVFTLTDDRLKNALKKAHSRNVAIRILTDDEKSRDAGSDIRALIAAGIPVRMDSSKYHFHHKFAVFDRAVLVCGSYNWTRGADQNNRENFLRTADPVLLHAYLEAFEQMWVELA
jgi:mitochondrial cardiolipin hydrolase